MTKPMVIIAIIAVWAIFAVTAGATLVTQADSYDDFHANSHADSRNEALMALVHALNNLGDHLHEMEGRMVPWLGNESLSYVLKAVGDHLHKIKGHVQPWFNPDTHKVISGFGLGAVIVGLFSARISTFGNRIDDWSSASSHWFALVPKFFFWCLRPLRLPMEEQGAYLVRRIEGLEQNLSAVKVERNAEKDQTEAAKKKAADLQVIIDNYAERQSKAENTNKSLRAELDKVEEKAAAQSAKANAAESDLKDAEANAKHARDQLASQRQRASLAKEEASKQHSNVSFYRELSATNELKANAANLEVLKLKARADGADVKLIQAETEIAEYRAKIAEYRAKIATLEATVAGFAEHDVRIAKLEGTVAEHSARIAELRARSTAGDREA